MNFKVNAFLNRALSSAVVKNILIVCAGVLGAQAINMLFYPIITRIYGPEVLGLLGIFIGLVSIITPISALTYPIAIILPVQDKNAQALMGISFYISLITSILTFVLLYFFSKSILELMNAETIAPYIMLAPLSVFSFALFQILQHWLIRKKSFPRLARVGVIQAFILNILKVGLGGLSPSAVILIAISVFSNFLYTAMLLKSYRKIKELKNVLFDFSRMKFIAKKYSDFPIFRSPKDLLSSFAQNLPIFILAPLFGPASVGYFMLARMVVSIPSQLIGKGIGDVLYPRITEAYRNGECTYTLIYKSTLTLLITGAVPFLLLMIFSPYIFGFVFGADWVESGVYTRWLSIYFYFAFISRVSSLAMPILSLQKEHLMIEIVSILLKVIALFSGYFFFNQAEYSIGFYSLAGMIQFILTISLVFFVAKKHKNSVHSNINDKSIKFLR
ncbi:polysaccharide biosynthesis protein [Psychrosphaera saromensis]|uniref:lipopolysaccharide biosynthesis protein n=1 Tax=Psychrosphaera saromensis TaxID=716813 RepID=UPI0015E389C9|nr:oligosaccharide flippase family protein [Psychrosphaera saromensis]GHB57394.1 polysaccharide biosynthesis protein [Psychrosphaera saromensis]GLQ14009.1 polysaccharide biosynthesis protein [Psychrosphaera saromensis]